MSSAIQKCDPNPDFYDRNRHLGAEFLQNSVTQTTMEASLTEEEKEILRYSVSLVRQGKHKFYTLTMPSDVLAKTCFVSARYEDPKEGFQRILDKNRAQQIADYIDTGLGTIPTSIVLSAQPEAELTDIGKGKTIKFNAAKKAFLILDGQHRVYGFSLAKTALRVPVVVYNGLSRRDESRLFIDINTKQRPVPNELLLDIKKLAQYETDIEKQLSEIFDLFNSDTTSPLLGLMSPAERTEGKISRVTFNTALKPLISVFGSNDSDEIYQALSAFYTAFINGLDGIEASAAITKPAVFRAVAMLFPEVGQRVKDKFGKSYTVDTFSEVLTPMFSRLKSATLRKPGNSPKELYGLFSSTLRTSFTL
jgi:DGQHR domain-containing protein